MKKEVTIVIATYNRFNVLLETIKSYSQTYVKEIIVIDDCSDFFGDIHFFYKSHIPIKVIKNDERRGAYFCKMLGAKLASTELIFFGEDDAFIENNYIEKLVNFYCEKSNLGVVSGCIVYMPQYADYNEIEPYSILKKEKLFDYNKLKFNPFCKITVSTKVPFTHALFITKKEFLINYIKDEFYSKGNGYREETDFQMALFIEGRDNYIINDCFCFHLSNKDVPSGGQRMNIFIKFLWTIYFNNYFLNKYYNDYKILVGINQNLIIAKLNFIFDQINNIFIKPIVRRIL